MSTHCCLFRFRVPTRCNAMSLPCTFSLKTVEFSIKLGMGMKCSSRHTFAPIDSTFCTPRIYILASGALRRPTIGRSRPRGGPTPSSILVCAPSSCVSGGPTPSPLPRNGPSRPGGGPTASLPPPYRCVYHPGGRLFFN